MCRPNIDGWFVQVRVVLFLGSPLDLCFDRTIPVTILGSVG